MIRVTVEVWPYGSEERKRTLGGLDICNVGGDKNTGHYQVFKLNKELKRCKQGHVKDYKRLTQSFWNLIAQALDSVRGK